MIKLEDIEETIAEYQGVKKPTINTCIGLAALYTVKNELFKKADNPNGALNLDSFGYSYQPPQIETTRQLVDIDSDSEFARVVNGRNADDVWAVIDELMTTISVTNPRLYNAVMRKLRE